MITKTTISTPVEVKSFSEFNRGCFVRYKDGGEKIVLVTNPVGESRFGFAGTVVHSSNPEEVGDHQTGWAKSSFEPFEGVLTAVSRK